MSNDVQFGRSATTAATAAARRVVSVVACGGVGGAFGAGLRARLRGRPEVGFRYCDTARPADVPTTQFTELRPDFLPDTVDERLAALLAHVGVQPAEYRRWKLHVGAAGIAQLPFLANVGGMYKVDELRAAIESDFRALSAAAGGAGSSWLVTVASGLGGTGAPLSRVAGLAFRIAVDGIAADSHWLHVMVTSSVLPSEVVSRRTRALEHRQLIELRRLMSPEARLTLPGRRAPIEKPGPDSVWLVASCAEAPRSIDEAMDEVAAVIANLVTT